jgi:hypothetical protein
MKPAVNLEGDYGKSNQCASAASCGAARSAVARGEVGSGNFGDRVLERYGNIPEDKPTDPNGIGSFAAENGAGTKGEMGKGWEGIAFSGGSENDWLCTREAHHVSLSPQEDRGGTAGTLGAGEGASEEESGLEPRELAPRMRQAFVLEVNLCAVRTVETLKSSEMLEA